MKKYLLYILITFCSVAKAQFTVQDIRIGDTLTSYLDFEFWQDGKQSIHRHLLSILHFNGK